MRKSLLVLMCSAALCGNAVASDVMRVDGERSTTPEKTQSERSVRMKAYPVASEAQVRLQPLAQKRIDAVVQENAKDVGRPMRVGVPRDVLSDADGSAAAELQWVPASDGGLVARLSVTSPGAASLRVGFDVSAIPEGAELRFLESPKGAAVVEVARAAEITRMHRDNPVYWSPVTAGETQSVEFYLPQGAVPAQLRYRVDGVSHMLLSPQQILAGEKVGESDPCEIDVRCATNPSAAFTAAKDAVARMLYQEGNQTFTCTGTLLNDTVTTSQIPYFYSANHCIDSQAAASTLTTLWFEEATSCNSRVRGQFTQVGGGATLLFNSAATDALLLRLNNAAPAGATFSGWDGNPVSSGNGITVFHHPKGDVKKVSQGAVKGFVTPSGESSTFINVGYTVASTEVGSSGSGLLTLSGDQYYLRGGLYGGQAGCSNTGNLNNQGNDDYFSRFDLVLPSVRQFLAPAGGSTGPRITEGMSGIWGDPAVPGQGFTFEANAATSVFGIGWFTWSQTTGEYLWFSGAGQYSNGNSVTIAVSRTRGGRFATATNVSTTPAGTLTITFTACDRATVAYSLTDPTLSGTINIARVLPASSLCTN